MHIVLISALATRFIDFKALKHSGTRISLLMEEAERPWLPEEIRQEFVMIREVSGGDAHGPGVALNAAASQAAISEMIKTAPHEQWRLLSLNECSVILAAELSEIFGLPTVSSRDLVFYRDKEKMKQRLIAGGVRVPRFVSLDIRELQSHPERAFSELKATLGSLPLIIKPTDSAGSYGVELIHNLEEFEVWLKTCTDLEYFHYEAEEYIHGKLYHCDTAIEQGKTIFSECSEYSWPNMEILQNKVLASIPLYPEDPIRQRLLDFADRALTVLGKINTVSHMEIFCSGQDELVFLEIGARPAGAMIQRMYQHDFNVSLANLYCRVMAGVPYTLPVSKMKDHYSFWAYFPKPTGKVVSCIAPKLVSPHELQWLVKPGDVNPPSHSLVDTSAKLFVTNSNRQQLWQDFQAVKMHHPLQVKEISHGSLA